MDNVIDTTSRYGRSPLYREAFSRGDAEAVVALYAEDATIEDPVGTSLMRGHAEIREFYTVAMATGAKFELLGPFGVRNMTQV